jgi:hypothetical protein
VAVTLDNRQRRDIDGRLELTVSGVEVGWRVIIEEHANQDPIERTDCRHPAKLILPPISRAPPTAGKHALGR